MTTDEWRRQIAAWEYQMDLHIAAGDVAGAEYFAKAIHTAQTQFPELVEFENEKVSLRHVWAP